MTGKQYSEVIFPAILRLAMRSESLYIAANLKAASA
jgi:hypothetical protein